MILGTVILFASDLSSISSSIAFSGGNFIAIVHQEFMNGWHKVDLSFLDVFVSSSLIKVCSFSIFSEITNQIDGDGYDSKLFPVIYRTMLYIEEHLITCVYPWTELSGRSDCAFDPFCTLESEIAARFVTMISISVIRVAWNCPSITLTLSRWHYFLWVFSVRIHPRVSILCIFKTMRTCHVPL